MLWKPEAYLVPYRTPKMEPFAKIVKYSGKSSIIDIWQGPKYTSESLNSMYLFKVNNRSTRKMCEVGSKLTIKTPERCSGVFFC